jgi:putative DNA primase/helicase
MSGASARASAPTVAPTAGADQASVAEWLAWTLRDAVRWVAELNGWAFRDVLGDMRWRTGPAANARVREEVTKLVQAHATTFTTGRAGHAMRALHWIAAVERGMWEGQEYLHMPLPEWDANGSFLQTPGGVVDLLYGKLSPTGLGDFNLQCTAVTPMQGPCVAIDRFLDESFRGDTELIEFVEEFYGTALRGNARRQEALMLVGEGNSGKSTLVNLMRNIAGDYACKLNDNAFIDTPYVNGRDYAMAALVGRRLAVASEVRKGAVIDEAAFKRLVSGDEVQARKPGCMPFSFVPQATTIMALNDMPELRSGGVAMRRRMRIVTMNHEVRVMDDDLPDAMMQEGSQWLARCLGRAEFAYLNGRAPVPQDVEDNVNVVVAGVDVVAAWWDECGEVTNASTDLLWVDVVWPQVCAWMHANGRSTATFTERACQFQFRQMLDRKSNGVLGKTKKVQVKGERKQAFEGIKLNKTLANGGAFGGP